MTPPGNPEATAALTEVKTPTHGFDPGNLGIQDRDQPIPSLSPNPDAVSEMTGQPRGTKEQGDTLDKKDQDDMNLVRARRLVLKQPEVLTQHTG